MEKAKSSIVSISHPKAKKINDLNLKVANYKFMSNLLSFAKKTYNQFIHMLHFANEIN
jgi:hypothetical protein